MVDPGGTGPVLCRYTCPICGAEELRLSGEDCPRERLTNELANHIEMSDDDRHGAKFSAPEEVPGNLADHVEVRPVGD